MKLIRKNWKEVVENTLSNVIDPDFILIFGSYAKGSERVGSDLDIAYFSHNKLSDYDRFLIAQQLAEQLKTEVDLVNIKTIDTVFAAQIFFTGKLISCKDRNEFNKQRMKALSMYVTLNEQRKKIIEQVDERGYIYEE
ncbi:nucleotidyltransferase domain-containing protein [Pseudogracilibacillus auburnensis]|uniref:type VII toxin-antitoxin system MntA family adenylyltransferase antitoxin n=1 Tax=Pseudogracilibacillus auburnensis TaxID=1494959 RepID=UPI000D76425E